VKVSAEQAKMMRELWMDAFPEMEKHLDPPRDPAHPDYFIGRTLTGRKRSRSEFCAACNYP
jgi:hypothetical protein